MPRPLRDVWRRVLHHLLVLIGAQRTMRAAEHALRCSLSGKRILNRRGGAVGRYREIRGKVPAEDLSLDRQAGRTGAFRALRVTSERKC